MMRWICILSVLAAPALGEPRFAPVTDLPEHSYTGGWEHFVGGGLAVFDCDGDGLAEMFAAGGETPAILLKNTSGPGRIAFSRAPLPEMTGVTGAYPLDMDGDGVLDLYVMRAGPDIALKGSGDCRFADMTAAWGLPQEDRWTTAFTAWIAPGDTRPTLAVGHYVDRADPDGPFGACDDHLLLHPEGAGWRAEPLTPGFCTLSMLAARDARGRMSLRISNDRHYYIRDGVEQMWDIAGARFLSEADGWPQVSLWGMGIASRDLTGDGRDEVMLTSMGDQVLQIARADGGYDAAPYSIGTYAQRPHTGDDGRPSTGWHAEFGDVDNDTRADLFIAKGNVDQMPGNAMRDPNNLLMQQADGSFAEAADAAGVADTARSRGAALADLDGDGLLDLAVVNRRAPLRVWRNVTEGAGNWLAVALPPSAIGARVSVATGGATQTRQFTVGGGHTGGAMLPLHFGLGAAGSATVTVEWRDGTVAPPIAVSTNRVISLPAE